MAEKLVENVRLKSRRSLPGPLAKEYAPLPNQFSLQADASPQRSPNEAANDHQAKPDTRPDSRDYSISSGIASATATEATGNLSTAQSSRKHSYDEIVSSTDHKQIEMICQLSKDVSLLKSHFDGRFDNLEARMSKLQGSVDEVKQLTSNNSDAIASGNEKITQLEDVVNSKMWTGSASAVSVATTSASEVDSESNKINFDATQNLQNSSYKHTSSVTFRSTQSRKSRSPNSEKFEGVFHETCSASAESSITIKSVKVRIVTVFIGMFVCVCACVCVCVCTCIPVYVCTHARVYLHACACVCTRECVEAGLGHLVTICLDQIIISV